MSTRAVILKEVQRKLPDNDSLCLQQVIFTHSDGSNDLPSFRFIRRCDKGNMKAQRGQAAFISLDVIEELVNDMRKISFKF